MPTQIKKVTLSKLNSWEPKEGEICEVVTENNKHYKYKIYHEGEWKDIEMKDSGIEMGLYDMNKQIIAQLPTIEKENIQEKIDMINEFAVNNKNFYYMLYGKEISYFTLFKRAPYYEEDRIGEVMIECLDSIGDIKAIDYTEAQDAIEVWVVNEDGPTCLYLFPYDSGVVSVGE